jgi:DNA mismatch repair protein MutS2
LIDEIGSGTDPSEGSSIATALLECLSEINCVTIATTHHGALKSFAFETPHFINGGMEFSQESLQPTYRFRAGIPGSSYAIEMAERMQLPARIIDRSKSLRGAQANKLDSLIIDLENKVQELKKNLDRVSEEKSRYDSLNALYQDRITQLEKELKQIKAQAIHEAQNIVATASATIEKLVKEIKEGAAEKQIVTTARQEIKKLKGELDDVRKEIDIEVEPYQDFHLGDEVELKNSDSVGEIVAKPDEKHFTILVGALKVKAHRDELRRPRRLARPTIRSLPVYEHPASVKQEIDLRGMYSQDAINAVDKFLDEAIISGLHRVSLIHGKGTGALRRQITEYLKKNASIKSYRMGEWNEGGSGVTVVELT